MTNKMTETRYRYLWLNCHAGICLACGAVKEYDCEPDAEGYECDAMRFALKLAPEAAPGATVDFVLFDIVDGMGKAYDDVLLRVPVH